MTTDDRDARCRATRVSGIAPEADLDALRSRRQTSATSSTSTRWTSSTSSIALHDETGVDIPEADYGQVATLDGLVGYVSERVAAGLSRP